MRRVCLMLAVLAVVGVQAAAYGAFSGTFVGSTPIRDANPSEGNTDSADPSLLEGDWLGPVEKTADRWFWRNTSGSDGWVFQSNRSPGLGDSPMLVTTLTGLKAGRQYNIYVAFAKAGTNDCIYAGFATDQLVFFNVNNTPNANIPGKTIFEGFVGMAQADAAGTIKVYVDDETNPSDGNQRTLYDGLVYSEPLATEPLPADASINVALDASLSWLKSVEPLVTKQYLYFDELTEAEPNFAGITPVTVTDLTDPIESAAPVALQYDKTYFWRVDSSVNDSLPSDANTITGSVWTFSTLPSSPVVTGPADQIVVLGQPAQFDVSVTSVHPITSYVWWKSADAVVGDDTMVSGAETATLSFAAAAGTDEAYYYCTVTSSKGVSSNSQVAKLGVKRQVAHWTLDALVSGQYADSSSEGRHADPNGTPAAVTGVLNGGFAVDAVNGWANAGTWDPSHITDELTVCGWVKWNGGTSSQNILAKRDGWGDTQMMWQFGTSGSGLLRMQCAGKQTVSTSALRSGEWTFVAASVNGSSATVYQVDENNVNFISQTGTFGFGSKRDAAFVIGCSDVTGSEFFDGALDEIQVFNYAMDAKGIADLYNQVKPKAFCLEGYASAYDYNNNCKVDLADFAVMAENWLSCGFYPQSACQ